MKSWQTTVAGMGCIGLGAYLLTSGKEGAVVQGAGLIAAGLGLIRAKDASVHSDSEEVAKAESDKNEKALKAANQQ